ncbi:hypothetical protein CPLU01_12319 [Colletotrichum plurivorum]|uniref:Uncharacterized protein n=1 Tax=Colletotrichum plurivorum TaxID=2175906 RepID=A0A8H6JZI5_9PEZI|nr:hypothetical protein CPLU01_12319 [Colletotrichum plurivorum]
MGMHRSASFRRLALDMLGPSVFHVNLGHLSLPNAICRRSRGAVQMVRAGRVDYQVTSVPITSVSSSHQTTPAAANPYEWEAVSWISI